MPGEKENNPWKSSCQGTSPWIVLVQTLQIEHRLVAHVA